MSMSDHVTLSITAQTQTVSRAGFGVPLLMVHHTLPGNLVRTYKNIIEVASDFSANHPAYHMAAQAFAQSHRPEKVKIGKMTNASAQTGTIKGFPANSADADVGRVVSFKVLGPTGVVTTCSHTIVSGNDAAAIATALETQVEAIANMASVVSTDEIDFTADNVGDHFYFYAFTLCAFEDTTVALNYDTALAAIILEDDDFYGIAIEHNSSANIQDLSDDVEALKKIFCAHYQGTEADFVTLMTTLKATGRDRTFVQFTQGRNMPEYPALAIMARMLTTNPGSATWKFKNLKSVTYDVITTTNQGLIKAQNGNIYVVDGGVAIVQEGVAVSGEFMDTTRFLDWLEARIKERVFSLFVNVDKVDYDDVGVDQVVNEVEAVLQQGVERRGLRSDPAPFATAPKVADIDTADRGARLVPDISFSGQLRGAIHKVNIQGTVSV